MENVIPKRAKLRCMNLLKSREYTRQQMEEKLRQESILLRSLKRLLLMWNPLGT